MQVLREKVNVFKWLMKDSTAEILTGYILKTDVTVLFLNVNIYNSLEITSPPTINSIFCPFLFLKQLLAIKYMYHL